MRRTDSFTPLDLARVVSTELARRTKQKFPMLVLRALFEALYSASLRTEERQQIDCHFVYLDPDNPDPTPPPRIVRNRWVYIPFAESVLLSSANIGKIAKAFDPRTSSFVIYPDRKGRLRIWGLVDQGNTYFAFMHFDSDSGMPHPGIFQVTVAGVGHLIAYVLSRKVGELKIDRLSRQPIDVIWRGPFAEALQSGPLDYARSVSSTLTGNVRSTRFQHAYVRSWLSNLCRILQRARNYSHGGALLITSDDSLRHLNVKHKLKYSRFGSSIHRYVLSMIEQWDARNAIRLDRTVLSISPDTYRREVLSGINIRDSESEIDGVVWFLSLLTRVDGLVLATPNLDILGFGVEILSQREPSRVFRAIDAQAKELRRARYEDYGTRHRSMLRYCSEVPGSIGFVMSQDGDVRAVARVRGRLTIWDDVALTFTGLTISKKRDSRGTRRVRRT